MNTYLINDEVKDASYYPTVVIQADRCTIEQKWVVFYNSEGKPVFRIRKDSVLTLSTEYGDAAGTASQ